MAFVVGLDTDNWDVEVRNRGTRSRSHLSKRKYTRDNYQRTSRGGGIRAYKGTRLVRARVWTLPHFGGVWTASTRGQKDEEDAF